jgi:hypothetical protein
VSIATRIPRQGNRISRKGNCFSCGKPMGDYRASTGGPSGSGTARVGGQNISFTYSGTTSVFGDCENCGDPDPDRRWMRWRKWRNLTSLGMFLIVMELFIGSFLVWGILMTERKPVHQHGGFVPWVAFPAIFVVGCMLAAWARSFRWLSVPLVVSLVGLLIYIVEHFPKSMHLPVSETEVVAASVAYNVIAVALLLCVSRKPFA